MGNLVRRGKRVLLGPVAGVMALGVLAGCSAAADTGGGGSDSDATAAVKAADAQLAIARKGRMTQPPSAPNPAVKGKKVWIIQSTAAGPSVSIPALAAQEAGKALGWKTTLYDAKGDPGNYTKGVSDAIANGADGIVLVAIDCTYVKNQLQQAKSRGIAVSEVYAFDCADTNPGSPRLFSADLSFGKRWKSLLDAWQQWGSDTAAWIISATKGRARPLVLHNEQIAVLISYQKGFEERMAQCKTCKTVNVSWDATTSGTPAALAALIKNASLQHPEINSSMFGSTVTSGYNQAILSLGAKAKQVKVIAGLGLPDEFNLIKADRGLNATTAWPQEWIGYAAMDSINSVLAGRPRRDEGIGWQIIDNTNPDQMPQGKSIWQGSDDFRSVYRKSWGVS
ncbi:substrate-binding domain-containing protein [Streptomyces carpinensis]|uniref:Substrate-binding domain-containing protein n=1 Tax=Streptomyces carpinensis TaxID=66369 RepID=A0ABV1W059_9ACTN|nr:substrate-binding domain-containing protein [Streptomyces carpinensis]